LILLNFVKVHITINTGRLLLKQFASSPEVADVGHARTDKDFVNFLACDFRQQTRIVRVIRRTQNGLFNFSQINFDNFGVLGILVSRCPSSTSRG